MRHQHPTDREKNRAARPDTLDPTQPLDIIPWMMRRLGAVIELEDRKGDGADAKRIDAALAAMAGLVRTAAPYRHPRIKPADPPQENVRQIVEICWARTPERGREPSNSNAPPSPSHPISSSLEIGTIDAQVGQATTCGDGPPP